MVSNLGRVKSVARRCITSYGATRIVYERILKQFKTSDGYYAVNLVDKENGKRKQFRVHRLVLLAFKGAPPEGMVACHNDGDVSNNKLSNLRWDTQQGNQKDRIRHGTSTRGTQRGCNKLSRKQVIKIKKSLLIDNSYKNVKKLAKKYNVPESTVENIRANRTWKYLKILEDANGINT